MSKKRHTADEIVAKVWQVDVLTAQGRTVAEAIRSIGVTEVVNRHGVRTPIGARPTCNPLILLALTEPSGRYTSAPFYNQDP